MGKARIIFEFEASAEDAEVFSKLINDKRTVRTFIEIGKALVAQMGEEQRKAFRDPAIAEAAMKRWFSWTPSSWFKNNDKP